MGSFQVRYDSRVVIYERKLFITLATDLVIKVAHFFRKLPKEQFLLKK